MGGGLHVAVLVHVRLLGPDRPFESVSRPVIAGRAHWGSLAARTSAGRISGGPSRSRSALASRAEAIGPCRCTWRSRSEGNASTIQKVVVSVRSANQAVVPCSWL